MKRRSVREPPIEFVDAWARLADQTLPVCKRNQPKIIESKIVPTGNTTNPNIG
jgi:hypothetical protein